MRIRQHSVATAASLKPYWQRGFLAALVTLSVLLIYSERSNSRLADGIRMALLDVVLPVVDVLSQPVQAFNDLMAEISAIAHVHEINSQLMRENEQLLEWKRSAVRLESENRGLRELMNYQPVAAHSFVSARTIGQPYGSMAHKMHVDAGRQQGVQAGQPVINAHGLLGRVIGASTHHAQVLLLTDLNSRIPVQLQPSGHKAILMGDREAMPYLKLQDPNAQLELGDEVLSAGDGGVMTAGLQVGKLFAQRDGVWRVRLESQQADMQYVRVVRTHMPASTSKQ